jgi:superfamily II DNA/RNA helicase
MTFPDLGLSEAVCRAVADVGYTDPTPIQKDAIPLVLMGRDLIATAQTGTGKTAAFTLPMIDILAGHRARARMPRSLILEPTRELAQQVAENFDIYGKYNKLSHALIIGGENMDDQIKLLDRGVDVLIATPGRLLDLFERGRILLTDIKVLVIDEADRMLDMGFIPDIEKICKLLPVMRQTVMFSATMAPEIKRLTEQFLMNPKSVSVAPPASTSVNVEQHLVLTSERDKREVLRHLLRTHNVRNAFIFCNRKKDIGVLQRSLERHGFSAVALHGDMPQSARTATLEAFKAERVPLLVCSDVAARGIDIADVSHVFNFDVPIHSEDYVHRIGRTGRAGRQGTAFTLATPDDDKFVAAIEKLIKRPIPRLALEGFAPAAPRQRDRQQHERPHREQTRQHPQRNHDHAPRRTPHPADVVESLPDSTCSFGNDLPAFLARPRQSAGN